MAGGGGTFALEELSARHTAGDEGPVVGCFTGQTHGSLVDDFGLRAVTGAVELLARGEKRQCLKHSRARVKEFLVQQAQGFGMLDCYFRSELAAATASTDLFTPRPAVHVTTAFELEQVPAVAQNDAVFKQVENFRRHGFPRVVFGGSDESRWGGRFGGVYFHAHWLGCGVGFFVAQRHNRTQGQSNSDPLAKRNLLAQNRYGQRDGHQ